MNFFIKLRKYFDFKLGTSNWLNVILNYVIEVNLKKNSMSFLFVINNSKIWKVIPYKKHNKQFQSTLNKRKAKEKKSKILLACI